MKAVFVFLGAALWVWSGLSYAEEIKKAPPGSLRYLEVLHQAIADCDEQMLAVVLKMNPTLVNEAESLSGDYNGPWGAFVAPTPLMRSTQCLSNQVMLILLNTPGVKIDGFDDEYDDTALMYAALGGDLPKVQLLLKYGARVKQLPQRNSYDTPLMYAVQGANLDIIKLLIQRGADVNAIGWRTSVLGHIVHIREENSDRTDEVLQLLMRYGAEVNLKPKQSYQSPLSYAIELINAPAAEALFKVNARVERWMLFDLAYWFAEKNRILVHPENGDKAIRTYLTQALASRAIRIAEPLLNKGADVNYVSASWSDSTPLFVMFRVGFFDYEWGAMNKGARKFIKFLLDKGADPSKPSMKDECGGWGGACSALDAAVSRSLDPEIIRMLVSKMSAEAINRPWGGVFDTALSVTLSKWWPTRQNVNVILQIVEILLQAGARVDIKGKKGQTALEILEELKSNKKAVQFVQDIEALFKKYAG